MRSKPKFTASMSCPDKHGNIQGEPMWKAMAFPFHIIGKVCKKCGKPVYEHGVITKPADTQAQEK